ncbi:hypothetical protein CRUP_019098 [Coryphaenoides rupestris]|nr:hypothetical protein CRUP_019098 [Coryphaenoides rupestris]
MASTGSSGQSRKKKAASPGLLDQINTFFGGDKKKRSKGSFRGHLSTSPQQSAARRRPNESAVAHFFRSFTSSPRAESAKSPLRRRRDQSTLSRLFNLTSTDDNQDMDSPETGGPNPGPSDGEEESAAFGKDIKTSTNANP